MRYPADHLARPRGRADLELGEVLAGVEYVLDRSDWDGRHGPNEELSEGVSVRRRLENGVEVVGANSIQNETGVIMVCK